MRARAVLEPGPGTKAELVMGAAAEEEAESVSCLFLPFLAPLVRGLKEAELSLVPPPPPLLFLVFRVLTIVLVISFLSVSLVIFGNNTREMV